jgi:hypothetical protein
VVLLAGWLLYELTAEPALAVALACGKFGWSDARSAFWLRRVDPDRRRGAACFWWYLTFGLWKVALTATLTMILLGYVSLALGGGAAPPPPRQAPSPVLGGALLAAAVGFGLSFLSSYVALWAALRHGVRIWLGVAPHRARHGRFWPPCHGQVNFAPYVTFTTMVLTIVASLATVVTAVTVLDWRPQGPLGAFAVMTLVLGLTCGVLTAYPALAGRVMARSPQECWPPDPDESAVQAIAREPA